MTPARKHISICICTFRRPGLLGALLSRLEQQQTNDRFTYSIVVTDNDAAQGSQQVVSAFAARSPIAITYSCEPRQNISLARNEVLRHATGDFVAFVDDDELPENDWLAAMLEAYEKYGASGVLGPVRARYEEPPPRWVIDGTSGTGGSMKPGTSWPGATAEPATCCCDARSSKICRKLSIRSSARAPEDQDFFRRLIDLGHVFVWCSEGVIYETVPKERCTRSYLLKRAMLGGSNSLNVPVGRAGRVAQSVAAVPAYLLMLPFALLLGQHVFMKYCVRFFHHTGRLLAVLRLNPVQQWS